MPLLAAYFNPATHWQGLPDRIRIYSTPGALAALAADGFSTTGVVYRAVEVMCSQATTPLQIAVGKRALPFTQILKLVCLSVIAGEPYRVTLMGTDGLALGHTYTSTGVPATDAPAIAALIIAQDAANLPTAEITVGTITVSGATITITQVAGSLTDISLWSPNFSLQDTTVDPGIVADLTAISAANTTGWYSVSLDSNSQSEVAAAAGWIEATGQGGKVGFFGNADTASVSVGSGDVNSVLEALTRVKSWVQQSNKEVLSCAGCGMASLATALSPGSYALSYKTIAGVIPDDPTSMSETQQLILNTASVANPGTGGKNGNWYQTISGLHLTFPGVTPGGRWMDTTIFIDWFVVNLAADLLAYFAGLPKVPLTDIGIQGAVAVIKSRIKIGGAAPYGGFDLTQPWSVTFPTAASLSQTDRNNRNCPGLGATAFLSGAINTAPVGVTVTE